MEKIMKIIMNPGEAELVMRFRDMEDLQYHVRNLGKMLEHNMMHAEGEDPHLHYIIMPDLATLERLVADTKAEQAGGEGS
jgi:hypothetical protein